MKTSVFIFMAVCLLPFLSIPGAYSQEVLEVKPVEAQMSKGLQPGYVVEIPMGILKDVQQNWIKKLQENTKVKVQVVQGELILRDAVKNEISPDTLSIYTMFIEKEDRLLMYVFTAFDSVFFSAREDKTDLATEKIDSGLKKYIRDFAVSQYRIGASKDLEAEEKLLEQKQKELEKLIKEKESMEKDNSSMENKIDQTEREVTGLENQIELKNQEILDQTTSMTAITGKEEKKVAEDKKKDLEKQKSKMEKDRTSSKNDISDMKASIDKNNKSIEDNLDQQEAKKKEIEAQQQEVAKAQAFLDGIK